jgi:hypothetical protein
VSGTIGISWQDAKQAALFCDRILPCADYNLVPAGLRIDYEILRPTYRRLASEYASDLTDWEEFVDFIHEPLESRDEVTAWIADDMVIAAAAALAWQSLDCIALQSRESDSEFHARLLYPEYYEDWREWYNERGRELGEPPPPEFPPVRVGDTVEVQLIGMGLIDTSNAAWEQIVEFKQDRTSVSALRNLRLLFEEKLRDKSATYIEDYVQVKLEAYEIARRKHGFETATSSLQLIMNSKTAAGAGAIAAAGMMTGHWGVFTSALGVGAALEAANLTLHIITRRRSFIWWSKTADLSYIVQAKAALER